MCSNYPGIKLEPAVGTLEDKIEHMSSYAHVVHTTAKQVISRRRKNENVYEISKTEKCTRKACKSTVFRANLWGLCCRRKFSPKFAKFSYPLLGQKQKCSMACSSFKNLIQVLVLNLKQPFLY